MRRLFGFQFATDIVTRLSPDRISKVACLGEYWSNALSSARSGTTKSRTRMKEKKKKKNTMELVRGATNFVEMVTMGWQVTGK